MDRSGFTRTQPHRLWAVLLLGAALTLAAAGTQARPRSWRTLTISGTPPTSVSAGQSYAFTPATNASRYRTVVFAIANKPAWATFSTSTGQLAGTPDATSVGTYPSIVIAASDGTTTATLAAFTVQVLAVAGAPAPPPPAPTPPPPAPAPTISGTPASSVVAGSSYSFQPSASDPSGKQLSFSVQNGPAWAGFSIATGQLYGTPGSAQTGTYANIVISTSDGTASSSLPAFSITVMSPPATTGTALLSLTPPAVNTDGSPLTDLAGMRVYYGTSATSLTQVLDLPGNAAATYSLANLASGTWYFAATAYNSAGLESSPSATASKSIP